MKDPRAKCATHDAISQAHAEIEEENFRAKVAEEKARLRKAKWWHRFVPFVIRIEGRK
jgi:hypothetical protein